MNNAANTAALNLNGRFPVVTFNGAFVAECATFSSALEIARLFNLAIRLGATDVASIIRDIIAVTPELQFSVSFDQREAA
jgi:3-oxoacyl-(acyl-carrier-protein) synthase